MSRNLQMTIETITPQIAESYLKSNKNIRKATPGVIAKYADDMKNGRWKLSSETIAFDKHGNLKDGQHRLLACIKSGCPFDTIVIRGIEDDADSVIDIGKARSASDQLKEREYSDKVAALSRTACATKTSPPSISIGTSIYGKRGGTGVSGVQSVISIPEQVEEAKANYDEYLYCVRLGNRIQKQFRKFGVAIYAYFIWLVRWLNEDSQLENFVNDLCAKKPESQTVSVAKTAIFRKENTHDRVWLVATLLYAYEAYCDGKEVEVIRQPLKVLGRWDSKVAAKKEDKHEIHNNEG